MGKIFSILLALALVLSVGLVTSMPVQANVSQPQVTVSPVQTNVTAEYTIVFEISGSLEEISDSITVAFPAVTTVPGAGNYSTGDIRINGYNVTGNDVTVAGQNVTMVTPIDIQGETTVTVVFTFGANITNPPTTGDYTLKVNTSHWADQTPVESAKYAIRELPTVTGVSPGRGNVGGTMWVVVKGTSFMGDEDTNFSSTNISFGGSSGVDVLQTKYISVNETNVQIKVNSSALYYVTAETPAGNSTTSGTFNATPAGTPQVDVWEKYTPTVLPFDEDTLVFKETVASITNAIAAASQDYTLAAHSDVYEEDLVIDVEGLTLMSVSGSAVTKIKGVTSENWFPGSANIEILSNGVKISGFTIESPNVPAGEYSGGIVLDSTDIEIYNNAFVSIGNYCVAIQTCRVDVFPDSDISGLKIYNNTFAGSAAVYQGVFLNRDTGAGQVTVSNNVFSGNVRRGIATERSNTVITGNTMTSGLATGTVDGITVYDWNDRAAANVSITGNNMSGFNHGIVIGGGNQVLTNISVTENTMQDNETGILVRSSADGVVINYNNIAGNTELGLNNTDDENLDALYNWWGHEIGPNHDTFNPGGQLNAVTGNASFSPWLYKPQEQFALDEPCLAGSVVLDNEAEEIEPGSYAGGWNSFSTPVTLDDSADEISDLLALAAAGNLSILRAQRFNPAKQSWDVLIVYDIVYENYQIRPGEGFYIQVQSKGSLPILVESDITSPPMRDLVAGWNLIGTSSLNKTSVKTALSGVDYSMVLSPKPPNDVAWSVPPSGENEKSLQLGKAYWVAMAEPGILYGFTYTPVASDMRWELNQ
jgi:parallel beta-helix repeat protein